MRGEEKMEVEENRPWQEHGSVGHIRSRYLVYESPQASGQRPLKIFNSVSSGAFSILTR